MSAKKKKSGAKAPKAKPRAVPLVKTKPRAPAPAPAPNGLSKKQKADLTRFARDVAAGYSDTYPNATVYKVKRALADNAEIKAAVLAAGGRVWANATIREQIEQLVKSLPATQFRQPMTPEERAAALKARQKALLDDALAGSLTPAALHALRAAYAKGLRKEAKRAAYAAFDAAVGDRP